MSSDKKLLSLAVVFALLLGTIQGYYYDHLDTWITSSWNVSLPQHAIVSGFDPYGAHSYVGRVMYYNSALPARIIPDIGRATFNSDTASNYLTEYQVLVSNSTMSYRWVRSFDGHVEKDAVCVGTSSSLQRTYICRSLADGGLLMGTLYPAQDACIIKYDDLPLRRFDRYEVLIRERRMARFTPFEDIDRTVVYYNRFNSTLN